MLTLYPNFCVRGFGTATVWSKHPCLLSNRCSVCVRVCTCACCVNCEPCVGRHINWSRRGSWGSEKAGESEKQILFWLFSVVTQPQPSTDLMTQTTAWVWDFRESRLHTAVNLISSHQHTYKQVTRHSSIVMYDMTLRHWGIVGCVQKGGRIGRLISLIVLIKIWQDSTT